MNSSSGLGQPSAGQPDFDGPPGDHAFQRPGPGQGSAPTPQQPAGQPWTPSGQPGPQDPATPPPQFGSAPGEFPGSHAQDQGRYGAPPGYAQPGTPDQYGAPGPYGQSGQYGQPGQSGYGSPQGGQQYANPLPGQQNPGGWGPPPTSASGQQHGQGPYPPPQQQQPAGSPSRQSRGRALIITGAVAAVVVLALLGWQLLAPRAAPVPTVSSQPTGAASSAPVSTEPTVVRASESPQPTTSADVTGGGVGQPIRYRATNGEAQVTVTKATWADNGVLEPEQGQSYLIVDVTFEGISGTVSTGPFFTRVVDGSGESHLLTVGAQLTSFLAMKTLAAGEKNTGQVAFELARGPAAFEVLSETLDTVAKVDIPG